MDDTGLVLMELSEKSDEALREILDKLFQEEQELSYQRRVLHAKIDILKAELTARLKEKHEQGKSIISARDIARLTEILSGETDRKSGK